MDASSLPCPQCGAPLEITNRYAKIVVCQYCGAHSALETGNAKILGQFPKLADVPTYLFTGAEGTIQGKKFRAAGRMRYQHKSGFWDEWFLLMEDGSPAWLTEDEGEFSLFEGRKIKSEIPEPDSIKVGTKITINDLVISVMEKGEAAVAGAEGELGFWTAPGSRIRYYEGVAAGKLAALEVSDDEIELFTGDEVMRKEIVITNRPQG